MAAAGAGAVLIPLALLMPGEVAKSPQAQPAPAPIRAGNQLALAAVYERPLFGAASQAESEVAPVDAPSLVGIVGRLGGDAVALVRTSEGTTRTLRIGESIDGWSLASLAIDAAFFTRGTERVRVPLPAG
ncbi:hypothetical protein [Sphingomonas sp.]|uniref:hypothetical protein n=1 Tax=Sphingomonas sp. TaxID=28214 RepID=UPI002EDBB547